jgi:hypothetical protein
MSKINNTWYQNEAASARPALRTEKWECVVRDKQRRVDTYAKQRPQETNSLAEGLTRHITKMLTCLLVLVACSKNNETDVSGKYDAPLQRSDTANVMLIASMLGLSDSMIKGEAHKITASHHELELLKTNFVADGEDSISISWRYFFRNANVFPLWIQDASATGAYYNPYVDCWVITSWGIDEQAITLSDISIVTGDTLLGKPVGIRPSWINDKGESFSDNFERSYDTQINTFQKRFPGDQPGDEMLELLSLASSQDRNILVDRLNSQVASIEPIYRSNTKAREMAMDFISSLVTDDIEYIRQSYQTKDSLVLETLLDLPPEIRPNLAPTGLYRVGDLQVITFGLPRQPRVVVMISYRDDAKEQSESERFLDLTLLGSI